LLRGLGTALTGYGFADRSCGGFGAYLCSDALADEVGHALFHTDERSSGSYGTTKRDAV
jgi:hypothetical protein